MMQKPVGGDHEGDAARSHFPAAQTDIARVIVVVGCRAFHRERPKTVTSNELSCFRVKELERWSPTERPLAIVSERAGRIGVSAYQIPVLTLNGTETRMKLAGHCVYAGAPHVARQHAIERATKRVRLPPFWHDNTDGLTQCVHAGVGPAGANRGNVILRQSSECVFNRTLYRALRGLSLPSGKGLAVILYKQLEGASRHWRKARPRRK